MLGADVGAERRSALRCDLAHPAPLQVSRLQQDLRRGIHRIDKWHGWSNPCEKWRLQWSLVATMQCSSCHVHHRWVLTAKAAMDTAELATVELATRIFSLLSTDVFRRHHRETGTQGHC
jgi:hypothetical protein